MSLFNPVPLSIVPCSLERQPALLETSLVLLSQYVATAPQWRLGRWSYAATADGQALLRGLPLPPLPGTQWVETEGVCVPAGCAWSPAVEPAIIRQLLQLAAGEIALLRKGGAWERVAADDWVRVSRSSFRRVPERQ